MKKIIFSLRHGLLSRVWPACAAVLVKWFGPRLSAYLTYLAIDWGAMDKEVTVLCLGRESFVKDIRELRARTGVNYPVVVGGFTRFQMGWTPAAMQVQTFYQAYRGAGAQQALVKSTQYAKSLILLASRRKKIHALLSANFDYWQDAGFKKACQELAIPFLVLSREHPVIPAVCDVVADWYRRAEYRFEGSAIAVAGESTRDVLERAGTICDADRIVMTGLPRFDAWLDVDSSRRADQRGLVTLLTFTEGYYADDTFKEVLQVFCEAAAQHQNESVKFLVKTKDMDDSLAVRRLIRELNCAAVECTHERELFEVLPDSRLVINYNSLSLVEAALANAVIVIPAWGQCQQRGPQAMYSADQAAVARLVRFAQGPGALREAIAASLSPGFFAPDAEARMAFVNHFVHLPAQGSCSQEFEKFLFARMAKP